MIRSTKTSLLALIVGLSAACGGPAKTATPADQKEPPAEAVLVDQASGGSSDVSKLVIPSAPVAAPATLMAEVLLSNPNHQITQIATFADAVQPGMGAFVTPASLMQMLEGMVGAVGIAGLDLNAPTYVTITDGNRFVIVGTVASEADLMDSLSSGSTQVITHEGFAAIGSSEALMEVAPYALSTLVKRPVPDKPTLSLYLSKILAGSHGDELRSDLMNNIGSDDASRAVAAVLIETINSVEVLHTSLDADPAAAVIAMQAIVKDGALKDFIGKQKPADFSVLDRIGTGPWGMVAAGRFDLSLIAPMVNKMVEAENNPMLTQIAAQLGNLGGEMAIALNMPKTPELVMAMELIDAASLAQILDSIVALAASQPNLDMGGMPATLKPLSLKTRGGSLHELKLNPANDFQKELYGKKGVSAFFGVAGNNLLATFGVNAKKYANVLVTANAKIPGKGTKLAAAVAQAKAAGESLLFAVDVLSLQGQRPPKDVDPILLGIGFSGNAVQARMVLPTEFVKEAAAGGLSN